MNDHSTASDQLKHQIKTLLLSLPPHPQNTHTHTEVTPGPQATVKWSLPQLHGLRSLAGGSLFGPPSSRMGKDRLPGSPQQEGSQARGASPHVAAKRCRDPGGLAQAQGGLAALCRLPAPYPRICGSSPSSGFARSLSLCVSCLCAFLCARKARFRVARPAGGAWGDVAAHPILSE